MSYRRWDIVQAKVVPCVDARTGKLVCTFVHGYVVPWTQWQNRYVPSRGTDGAHTLMLVHQVFDWSRLHGPPVSLIPCARRMYAFPFLWHRHANMEQPTVDFGIRVLALSLTKMPP